METEVTNMAKIIEVKVNKEAVKEIPNNVKNDVKVAKDELKYSFECLKWAFETVGGAAETAAKYWLAVPTMEPVKANVYR